jgi:glycosyltransferase involved in cell wall biosynthesis
MIKRVLVFSTDDHLHPAGGAEQAFGNISERMPDVEFDLICAKLRKGKVSYEKVKNVHIHRLGFGIPKTDGFFLALYGHYYAFKLMKKHSYDFMWSIMASYGAFAAVRVKKKTGLPFLLTLQEGDSLEYIYNKVKHVRSAFNEIFFIADGIQAISTFLLNWGKEMGYKGTLGKVIPNGVHIDAYTQTFDQNLVRTTRESFGFSSDALILFSTSRLEKKNGHKDVIKALPLLPSNVCFINWHVGALKDELEALARDLGVADRVKLAEGVAPTQVPLLVHAGDIFIRPSLSEGLGNSFLEAMAARKIIIGTNAGGIPDFLTDGQTGFVVGIEDPKSIAEAVLRIMKLTAEEKKVILDTAEALVREKYDWDLVATSMREMFTQVSLCKK